MNQKQPLYLQSGDTIAIVSTARKISEQEIAPAIEIIQRWGYKVLLGKNLFETHHQFAGTDALRLADFQNAIDNPEVKAVLCARGGYGTVRIIDHINWSNFLTSPKWIIGFSDVTVLHLHLNTLGVQSIHATMPILFNQEGNGRALSSLKNNLAGIAKPLEVKWHEFNVMGEATGQLVGGNLTIINQLIGTPSFPDMLGKILFLEDLDEYLYHIDRMMYQLSRAGVLQNLAGIIVGYLSGMHDNTVPYGKTVLEIICEHTQHLSIPVAFGVPVGHEADNIAVFCGKETTLQVRRDGVKITQNL